MNKHGQELWAIEFFTNESSAELIDWLNPENALNRTISNSTNISVDMGEETFYTYFCLQIKLNMLFFHNKTSDINDFKCFCYCRFYHLQANSDPVQTRTE